MDLIYNRIFLRHKGKNHPESPERLVSFGDLEETRIESGEKHLKLIYKDDYLELVKNACEKEINLDSDTYTNKYSYDVACHAVEASIMAAKENNFALVRPPGHHATSKRAMGFCLFNNIAVATRWLNERGKKVFILDIDGHHGNGTQDIFYREGKVLYLSVHQFPAFPGTGSVDEIGENDGKYLTINVPMPPYSGDDLFISTLSKMIPTIKQQFNPDVVAVSAGFDAHKDDPLLQLNLTENSYYEIGKLLSGNFKNIFACLEGGYNVSILPHCVSAFLMGINNQKAKLEFHEQRTTSSVAVEREFNSRMKKLKLNLCEYWDFKL